MAPWEPGVDVMSALRRVLSILSVLALTSGVAACGGSADPGGSGSTAPTSSQSPVVLANATRLDSALRSWVEASGLVGATAAVVSPEGSWAGAAGKDGAGRRLTADTAFPIASITKTVTGAEVLLLASRGAIDLDAPVTTYVTLPWDARGATVRQLLGMRSGFPTLQDDVLLPRVAADLQATWTEPERLALIDPQGARLGTLGAAPTGDMTGWYNSINFDVLALVVEKATGQPFATVVRRDLLAPQGLTRMWSQTAEKPAAPVVQVVDDQKWRLSSPTTGYLPSASWSSAMGTGGGSMAADAPTLARWGTLLYGGMAIPAPLVEQMTSGDSADGYGLATMRAVTDSGTLIVGHLGDARVAASLLLYWPDTHVCVVVLVPQHVDAATTPLPSLADTLASLAQMGT